MTDYCPACFENIDEFPCSFCGYQEAEHNSSSLAPGTRLENGRYVIGNVLGQGGFGITYLALDTKLNRKQAIKEYFPQTLSGRSSNSMTVSAYSGDKGEEYDYGLEKFLDEARVLAQFDDNPCIVSVDNFFEENNTGYMVMPFLEGTDLKSYLKSQPDSKISVEKAINILMPVMDALKEVHVRGLLHRDISPDNIYITTSGQIKLLDFGAARYAAAEHSHSITSLVKPGYSPVEQYRSKAKFGPQTDIYALGATLYRCITGEVPIASIDRAMGDEISWEDVSETVLNLPIIDLLKKTLKVDGNKRIQHVEELQRSLIQYSKPLGNTKPDNYDIAPSDTKEVVKSSKSETQKTLIQNHQINDSESETKVGEKVKNDKAFGFWVVAGSLYFVGLIFGASKGFFYIVDWVVYLFFALFLGYLGFLDFKQEKVQYFSVVCFVASFLGITMNHIINYFDLSFLWHSLGAAGAFTLILSCVLNDKLKTKKIAPLLLFLLTFVAQVFTYFVNNPMINIVLVVIAGLLLGRDLDKRYWKTRQ